MQGHICFLLKIAYFDENQQKWIKVETSFSDLAPMLPLTMHSNLAPALALLLNLAPALPLTMALNIAPSLPLCYVHAP